MEKIIDNYDLDQIGSNYPKDVYNPHGKDPLDFFEEIAKSQTELMQQQQEEMIKKRNLQVANREKLVEQRALRIAELTNTDVKMVEEIMLKKGQLGGSSRFDSVNIARPSGGFMM